MVKEMIHVTDIEKLKKRYPDARVQRAVRPKCGIEPYAVAHRDGGRAALLILQPDEIIRQALRDAAKKKR